MVESCKQNRKGREVLSLLMLSLHNITKPEFSKRPLDIMVFLTGIVKLGLILAELRKRSKLIHPDHSPFWLYRA